MLTNQFWTQKLIMYGEDINISRTMPLIA